MISRGLRYIRKKSLSLLNVTKRDLEELPCFVNGENTTSNRVLTTIARVITPFNTVNYTSRFMFLHYIVEPPPSDMREAAAAAAVGTTPVGTPGFDK